MRQALAVNSMQTWLYEGGPNNSNYNGNDQDPADGDPRVFFDDFHAFIMGAPVAPGDTISLQKDAANTAAFYDVDVVDLEAPPPPTTAPAGSLAITIYGAMADDPTTDSTSAIQTCIDDAQTQRKTRLDPARDVLPAHDEGAHGERDHHRGGRGLVQPDLPQRPLAELDPAGRRLQRDLMPREQLRHRLERAEPRVGRRRGRRHGYHRHQLVGRRHLDAAHGVRLLGVGDAEVSCENCRLTSIWADGCNLNNVSLTGTTGTNLTARNNFVRGTGDDAIAINSVDYNGAQEYTPMANITIENNTSIAPWGGKGVAIYGGSGHLVQNNYMSDTARYIGLGVGKFGVNGSDLVSATVTGNDVERCGGNAYMQGQPALHIGNGGDGQGVGVVENATVTNNLVRGALYNGVGFSTSNGIVFADNTIASPGLGGVVISPPFYPAPTGSATLTGNVVTGLLPGQVAFQNLSDGGYTVTQSGNSW